MKKVNFSTSNKLKEGQIFGYYTDELRTLEPRVKITANDSKAYFYYHYATAKESNQHTKRYPMLIELTKDGFLVDPLTGTKIFFVPPQKALSPYVTQGTVNYNSFYQSVETIEELKDMFLVIISDKLWKADDDFKQAYVKTTLTDIEGYTEIIETQQKIAQAHFEKSLALARSMTNSVEDAVAQTSKVIKTKAK